MGESDSEEKTNEYRVVTSGLSKITELMSKITLAQSLENKLWLSFQTNPKKVFKLLRLGESAGKLDDNLTFFQWLNYVNMYRDKKGEDYFSDYGLFKLLKDSRPETELLTVLQSMKRIPDMKTRAESMQLYLFEASPSSHKLLNEMWLKSRENPEDVFRILNLAKADLGVKYPEFIQKCSKPT
ncbi:Avirulence (Avh) protein [Phytophthora megakarya]|uniref:Avirulence (Avh) protein n=1 Tax=Phytophthora megakarya TaxID=4795 RepID=A0A225VEL5_9STRA|nr:Avirulence (Avh) protein [Phytophthora megakarya]